MEPIPDQKRSHMKISFRETFRNPLLSLPGTFRDSVFLQHLWEKLGKVGKSWSGIRQGNRVWNRSCLISQIHRYTAYTHICFFLVRACISHALSLSLCLYLSLSLCTSPGPTHLSRLSDPGACKTSGSSRCGPGGMSLTAIIPLEYLSCREASVLQRC